MEYLNVYLNEKLIGKLHHNQGQLNFIYENAYLINGTQALSASLPLSNETFDHKQTYPFFSGLLPDEPVRSKLSKYLHLSSSNVIGLLKAVGGECAGAISLYPTEDKIKLDQEYKYKVLNENEATALLSTLDRHPFLAGDEGIRISGAGAQDKLMIAFIDGKVAIPLENTPSTHIIKPSINYVNDSVFNEYFCLRLASRVGLASPNVNIIYLNSIPYYVIERYDRIPAKGDNKILRLHQEDFCQALDIPPEIKYENEGGPSIVDCFNLLSNRISLGKMPGITKLRLLDAILFNYLIGNGDAHGKNFSILYENQSENMAPLYDLLSTVIYDQPKKAKMAMKISSKYKFCDLQLRHFEQMANLINIKPSQVILRFKKLAKMTLLESQKLISELNSNEKFKNDIYNEINLLIQNQAKIII